MAARAAPRHTRALIQLDKAVEQSPAPLTSRLCTHRHAIRVAAAHRPTQTAIQQASTATALRRVVNPKAVGAAVRMQSVPAGTAPRVSAVRRGRPTWAASVAAVDRPIAAASVPTRTPAPTAATARQAVARIRPATARRASALPARVARLARSAEQARSAPRALASAPWAAHRIVAVALAGASRGRRVPPRGTSILPIPATIPRRA